MRAYLLSPQRQGTEASRGSPSHNSLRLQPLLLPQRQIAVQVAEGGPATRRHSQKRDTLRRSCCCPLVPNCHLLPSPQPQHQQPQEQFQEEQFQEEQLQEEQLQEEPKRIDSHIRSVGKGCHTTESSVPRAPPGSQRRAACRITYPQRQKRHTGERERRAASSPKISTIMAASQQPDRGAAPAITAPIKFAATQFGAACLQRGKRQPDA